MKLAAGLIPEQRTLYILNSLTKTEHRRRKEGKYLAEKKETLRVKNTSSRLTTAVKETNCS